MTKPPAARTPGRPLSSHPPGSIPAPQAAPAAPAPAPADTPHEAQASPPQRRPLSAPGRREDADVRLASSITALARCAPRAGRQALQPGRSDFTALAALLADITAHARLMRSQEPRP